MSKLPGKKYSWKGQLTRSDKKKNYTHFQSLCPKLSLNTSTQSQSLSILYKIQCVEIHSDIFYSRSRKNVDTVKLLLLFNTCGNLKNPSLTAICMKLYMHYYGLQFNAR